MLTFQSTHTGPAVDDASVSPSGAPLSDDNLHPPGGGNIPQAAVDSLFLEELRYLAECLSDYGDALETGGYRHVARDIMERAWHDLCRNVRDFLEPDSIANQFNVTDPWAV